MKICQQFFVLLLSTLCAGSAFGQLTTSTLTATQDTYTNTEFPTTNYGSDTTMRSGTTVSPQHHQRLFVEFDLSGIPSNAVIHSATLSLHRSDTILGTFDWITSQITQSWLEASVTNNAQPGLSSISGEAVTTTATTASTQQIDLKDLVQKMVYGSRDNNGWCVQVSDESDSSNTGSWFYTSESALSSRHPELEVEYYLPLSLSNIIVTHESDVSAADGGVSYSLSNGASTSYDYNWINPTGTSIDTNQTLTGVSYGWYGLEVTGDQYGEKLYMGFLVGTQCKKVTIAYNTNAQYTSSAYVSNRVIPGVEDQSDKNYSNLPVFITSNLDISGWFDYMSYLDFNLWMDDAFSVDKADLLFTGISHLNTGTTNEAEFDYVTSSWDESLVTYNSMPTSSTSPTLVFPSTTSNQQNFTADMTDFWNVWKQDNTTNYGVLFKLQIFDDDVDARQNYAPPSPAYGISSSPEWTFELSLLDEANPMVCSPVYAELSRNLTGVIYESFEDSLYISYDNEYSSSSSNLDYAIYYTDMVTPVQNDSTVPLTQSFGLNQRVLDVSGLTTGNVYVLEITNDKGEKRYLRFEKD